MELLGGHRQGGNGWDRWELNADDDFLFLAINMSLLCSSIYPFLSEYRLATNCVKLPLNDEKGQSEKETVMQSLCSTQPAAWPTQSDTNSRGKKIILSNVTVSVVVCFVPGMWAIWFPTGKPVRGLSNASNTQLIWQLTNHWSEYQLAGLRRKRRKNDNEEGKEIIRVRGRAGGDSSPQSLQHFCTATSKSIFFTFGVKACTGEQCFHTNIQT